MLPLLAVLAGLGAMGAYKYGKDKQKKKDQNAIITAQNANQKQNQKSVAQTIYNYNNLTDSTTGNTLFDFQQKTKRTLFGTSNNV